MDTGRTVDTDSALLSRFAHFLGRIRNSLHSIVNSMMATGCSTSKSNGLQVEAAWDSPFEAPAAEQESVGSLGGHLVDVGDGVIRVCDEMGVYPPDPQIALKTGRGLRVSDLLDEIKKLKDKSADVIDLKITHGGRTLVLPVHKSTGVAMVAEQVREMIGLPTFGGLVALYFKKKAPTRQDEKSELEKYPLHVRVVSDPYTEAMLQSCCAKGPVTTFVLPLDTYRPKDFGDLKQHVEGVMNALRRQSADDKEIDEVVEQLDGQGEVAEAEEDDCPSFLSETSEKKTLRDSLDRVQRLSRSSTDESLFKNKFNVLQEIRHVVRNQQSRKNNDQPSSIKKKKDCLHHEIRRNTRQKLLARALGDVNALAAAAAAAEWQKAKASRKDMKDVVRGAERLAAAKLMTSNRRSLELVLEEDEKEMRRWAKATLLSNPLAEEIAAELARRAVRNERKQRLETAKASHAAVAGMSPSSSKKAASGRPRVSEPDVSFKFKDLALHRCVCL